MKLMVLDGNSVINRAYYGVRALTTKDGFFTNAIYGFLNILEKVRGVGASARADLRGQVQEEGQGRVEAAGRPCAQRGDLVHAEGAGRALVGQGGVNVAVPQHDRAAFEGGAR